VFSDKMLFFNCCVWLLDSCSHPAQCSAI